MKYIFKNRPSDLRFITGHSSHWGDEFGHNCTVSEKSVEGSEQKPGVMNEVAYTVILLRDDPCACDWGPSFSIDNTNKYAYVPQIH